MKLSTILAVAIIALVGAAELASATYITFFTQRWYREDSYEEDITDQCHNVPAEFDNRISSLSSEDPTCVTLYDLADCTGDSVNVRLTSQALGRNVPASFEDRTSSARLC